MRVEGVSEGNMTMEKEEVGGEDCRMHPKPRDKGFLR